MSEFVAPRIIETDAIRLRPFVSEDAQALFSVLLGDPEVTAWLPMPTHADIEETRAFIRRCDAGWQSGTRYTWALEDAASATLLAAIELRPEPPRAEIGVVISKRSGHRRRRASLAALLKLIGWLLSQPQLCRIHAYCAPEGAAASTMPRLGFKLEGRLTNWEPRPNQGRIAGDALLFSITRDQADPQAPSIHRLGHADRVRALHCMGSRLQAASQVALLVATQTITQTTTSTTHEPRASNRFA
ncbi:MAG TPA: GNAT family protein [Paraburkholderia sp.]|nr:GNAT family protein [Paraburkholderia sp.]